MYKLRDNQHFLTKKLFNPHAALGSSSQTNPKVESPVLQYLYFCICWCTSAEQIYSKLCNPRLHKVKNSQWCNSRIFAEAPNTAIWDLNRSHNGNLVKKCMKI